MKSKVFSIGTIFLVLMVCTNCTKDEAPLTPEGEPSALKSTAGQNPSQILISETGGRLHELDMQTLNLEEFYQFEIDWGNFDIQYTSPFEIVIANYGNHRVDQLNLKTKEFQTLVEGSPLSQPIGLAVTPQGDLYIADQDGSIFSFNLQTQILNLVADRDPDGEPLCCPDGIIVSPGGGKVYFNNKGGFIYCITPKDKNIERIAYIPGAELNGMAYLHPHHIAVVSTDFPPALFLVDVKSGEVTTLHEGDPFRNPEDVVIDPQGKNLYIVDSDFKNTPPHDLPGIYVFNLPTKTLETLMAGDPLSGDLVDILLRPFTGIF